MSIPVETESLTRKDFVSDQEVRWCPGCGDYAILAQIQKIMPELGVPKENIVFISGIGCSSRFPYYMDTYGIHSIHGRAPSLATGLALANPDLTIFVITGDGDGLSIGGNHLLHACRRNVNLNIILFNNRIYGLTKGQYSPTSRQGSRTKSSPMGSIEQPLNPISVALAAEATFVARSMDNNVRHLADTLTLAAAHQGTSFVEVYQNCIIFNPEEWAELSDRRMRDERMLFLENGQPIVFGKSRDKGVRLGRGMRPEVVELGNGVTEDDLLSHDAASEPLAYMLSRLEHPVPMGVIRQVERPTFADGLLGQVSEARAKRGPGSLAELYRSADLWEVKPHAAAEATVKGKVAQGLDEEYFDEIDAELDGARTKDHMRDLLSQEVVCALSQKTPVAVEPKSSVANAIRQMRAHNIGSVMVVDKDGRLAGILTEYDILTKVACQVEDLVTASVGEYMTANPIAMTCDTPLTQALHLMSVRGFRHVPLVDEEARPVGMISFRDVVRYLKEGVV